MMTGMERATAIWALSLPRRRAIRAYLSSRKVAVQGCADRGVSEGPTQPGVALAFLPGPSARCRTGGRSGRAGPHHQVELRWGTCSCPGRFLGAAGRPAFQHWGNPGLSLARQS